MPEQREDVHRLPFVSSQLSRTNAELPLGVIDVDGAPEPVVLVQNKGINICAASRLDCPALPQPIDGQEVLGVVGQCFAVQPRMLGAIGARLAERTGVPTWGPACRISRVGALGSVRRG